MLPWTLPVAAAMTSAPKSEWRSFDWRNLHFPSPLGIAGGVDKDARNVLDWIRLGAGFVEIGTVTPNPQPGNPCPNIARDSKHEALWNRLGFPSQGMTRVLGRLKKLKRPLACPLFANIGKNASTNLENAHSDYATLLTGLADYVDGFVINISSPNTPGLRKLFEPEFLDRFLSQSLAASNRQKAPVLLKLSPDLTDEQQEFILNRSYEHGIDGWVLTNTSTGLRDGLSFPKESGGVSGRPLADLSRQRLKKAIGSLGSRRSGKLLVSVGGIMSPEDVRQRLDDGADLVQVYSALIFSGPYFFKQVVNSRRLA